MDQSREAHHPARPLHSPAVGAADDARVGAPAELLDGYLDLLAAASSGRLSGREDLERCTCRCPRRPAGPVAAR
jgi:hypothetical protein